MLPLLGEMLAKGKGRTSMMFMSACVVTTQFTITLIAAWVEHDQRDRAGHGPNRLRQLPRAADHAKHAQRGDRPDSVVRKGQCFSIDTGAGAGALNSRVSGMKNHRIAGRQPPRRPGTEIRFDHRSGER